MLLEKYNTVFICSCEANRQSANCGVPNLLTGSLQKLSSPAGRNSKVDSFAEKVDIRQRAEVGFGSGKNPRSNQKGRQTHVRLQEVLQRAEPGVGSEPTQPGREQ